jgi:hypothetical protein
VTPPVPTSFETLIFLAREREQLKLILGKKLFMAVHLKVDESLNEDLRIWRYMDLAKLISLLEKSAIWLARADTFKDRHEGRFPDNMLTFTKEIYEGIQKTYNSPVKNADDLQEYLVNNTFIS